MTSYEIGSPYWTTPLDCGHVPTKPEHFHSTGIPFTTGSATAQDGKTMCYACAAALDLEDIAQGKEVFGYVSSDGKSITTWAGIELLKVTYNGSSPTGWHGSPIHYVSARAANGRRYYGRNGGNGMAIKLKPYKD